MALSNIQYTYFGGPGPRLYIPLEPDYNQQTKPPHPSYDLDTWFLSLYIHEFSQSRLAEIKMGWMVIKTVKNNWKGLKGSEKVMTFRKTQENIVKSITGNKLPDYVSYRGLQYSDRLYETTWRKKKKEKLLPMEYVWLVANYQKENITLYSLCQKKPSINSLFFWGPLGEGGQKFIKSIICIQIIDHVSFWPPSPRGPTQKIMN